MGALCVGRILDVPLGRVLSLSYSALCSGVLPPTPAGSLISVRPAIAHVHPPLSSGFSHSLVTFPHFQLVVCDLAIHSFIRWWAGQNTSSRFMPMRGDYYVAKYRRLGKCVIRKLCNRELEKNTHD